MPKVRALTAAERMLQAENEAVAKFCHDMMEQINMERGRKDMTRGEMASFLGVTPNTYLHWRDGRMEKASVERVLRAAHRVGCRIEIVPGK